LELRQLKQEVTRQQAENERLRERNRILAAEIEELKTGLDSIEERARHDMGMVRDGETFYLIIDEDKKAP
jgi:cell division protein FtsB